MRESTRTCTQEGCDRKHCARGLCNMHYQRLRGDGDMTAVVRKSVGDVPCSHNGCSFMNYAAGLCKLHYSRNINGRPMDGPVRSKIGENHRTKCSVLGCDLRVKSKGKCEKHYLAESRRKRRGNAPRCEVLDCQMASEVRGLCNSHYRRFRKGQPPEAPVRTRRDDKSRTLCKELTCMGDRHACPEHDEDGSVGYRRRLVGKTGYVMVGMGVDYPTASANGFILEHRLMMELRLGRPLKRSENVHHIDGVKHNNSQGNLELWLVSQPKGQRVVDLFDRAQEIIAAYSDEIASIRQK